MGSTISRPSARSILGGRHLRACLVDDQVGALCVDWSAAEITLKLRSTGLDPNVVETWLARHGGGDPGIPSAPRTTASAAAPPLVLNADQRVGDLARLYAELTGAPVLGMAGPADAYDAVRDLADGRSLTLVLLGDRLDEALCQAISDANHARAKDERPPVRYGFLTALTPAHLAWLIVKTVILLARLPLPEAGFASWDVSGEQSRARRRDARSGTMTPSAVDAPWSDGGVDVLSVRAHGASFDLSLGQTVLCSHQRPPLPTALTRRGPSCFHDGICFRVRDGIAPPTSRFPAQEATPLVWCLDSCATVALQGNPFGPSSYASGLIAGAAVGVIGPFLDIVTAGGLTRIFEGVLATGGTLGDATAAACAFEPMRGFDRFLLLGSPDLQLLPRTQVEPDGGYCQLRGKNQQIWRINAATPGDAPLAILGDDGADHWAGAFCDPLPDDAGAAWLVTLEAPNDCDGWLHLGRVDGSLEPLARMTMRISASLETLRAYPFVDAEAGQLARCREWAAVLRGICASPRRVRTRPEAALALAQLYVALDTLHESIARRFLTEDVSLDRLPTTGFDLEPTERSADRCPRCGAALYVTRGRWRADPVQVRRWVQCSNCAGIALAPEKARLVVRAFTAQLRAATLELRAELWNRSDGTIHVLLAGQARAGPPESRWGPERVMLAPGEKRTIGFGADGLAAPGVISYRLLALCDGDIQLHGLRLPVESASCDGAAVAPLVLQS